MTYKVKEIFYSLQGEGARSGRAAVFCRFAGCNLWSGQERDRASARCNFCDTNFIDDAAVPVQHFPTASALAMTIATAWSGTNGKPYVICTGGEPLLQLDAPLIDALHAANFEIAVETNGTLPVRPGVDWLCVSPKAGVPLVQTWGNELKLVYPQDGLNPADLILFSFADFFIQPMAGPKLTYHTLLAVQYCLAHPCWRLSLQLHKQLNLP